MLPYLLTGILAVMYAVALTLAINGWVDFGLGWRSDVGCRLAVLEQQEPLPDWCITPTPDLEVEE